MSKAVLACVIARGPKHGAYVLEGPGEFGLDEASAE